MKNQPNIRWTIFQMKEAIKKCKSFDELSKYLRIDDIFYLRQYVEGVGIFDISHFKDK